MSADTPLSKRLSLWLRHRPDAAGLALDAAGWADTGAVLAACERAGLACDAARLAGLVEDSDKERALLWAELMDEPLEPAIADFERKQEFFRPAN
jgi:RNA:NAD 2'-phosphotransferase (TPT1/KptA family)